MPNIFYSTSTSYILNEPDPNGRYIYGFYIQPDYTLISDTTNVDIRNQLSISSTSLNIISTTVNSVNLPSLVQMQTYLLFYIDMIYLFILLLLFQSINLSQV